MQLPKKKTKPETNFMAFNTLIYGLPKTGKTTFASTVNEGENVLILASEKGYSHLSVYAQDIRSWEDILALPKALKETDYKVLVFDTIDITHRLCSRYVCKQNGWNDPGDGGFGKGFNAVKEEFTRVLNGLHLLGYSLIFISHAKEKMLKKKNGAEYTMMGTSLSQSVEIVVTGMADFVFYLHVDEYNERFIRTKGTTSYLAGDRSGKLPEKMPLDFKLIQKYLTGELVKPPTPKKETK